MSRPGRVDTPLFTLPGIGEKTMNQYITIGNVLICIGLVVDLLLVFTTGLDPKLAATIGLVGLGALFK